MKNDWCTGIRLKRVNLNQMHRTVKKLDHNPCIHRITQAKLANKLKTVLFQLQTILSN